MFWFFLCGFKDTNTLFLLNNTANEVKTMLQMTAFQSPSNNVRQNSIDNANGLRNPDHKAGGLIKTTLSN